MQTGLLWYDSDTRRGLEDKVGRAAQRYREKYGRWPNTCFVHPQTLAGNTKQELKLAGQRRNAEAVIRVLAAPNILLHHFWLGISSGESTESGGASAN